MTGRIKTDKERERETKRKRKLQKETATKWEQAQNKQTQLREIQRRHEAQHGEINEEKQRPNRIRKEYCTQMNAIIIPLSLHFSDSL